MAAEKVAKILLNIRNSGHKRFSSEIFRNLEIVKSYTKENKHHILYEFNVKDEFCNLHGNLHGGAISTLIDCVTSVHVWAMDPHNRFVTSTDLSSSFYLGVRPGQKLEITTQLLSMTENFAYTTALLTVKNDVVARGTQTLFFLNRTWSGP